MAQLPEGMFDAVPADVPVVDTSNYYRGLRDPKIPDIEDGLPESVWVSRQLGRPVIRAFNRVTTPHQRQASIECLIDL